MEEVLHQLKYIKTYKNCDKTAISTGYPDFWTINSSFQNGWPLKMCGWKS